MPDSPRFDPDITRRDEAPYWAAVMALAVRSGNTARQREAERHLRRLGVPMTVGPRRGRKAVRNGR